MKVNYLKQTQFGDFNKNAVHYVCIHSVDETTYVTLLALILNWLRRSTFKGGTDVGVKKARRVLPFKHTNFYKAKD